MTEKNIYQRVNTVMEKVEYVQKDTEVTGGGNYKAVSHDMVVAILRKEMVANGIVVRTNQIKGKYVQLRDQAAGLKMHLYQGRYRVDFVNMDNPQDFIGTIVEGHANDSGDKAPGKAMSYAVKYAMLKTFSLETGEDDEQRFSDPYTDAQLDLYHELIDNDKAYEFYMFMASLPVETATGLHNSFPDGKKSQGKKKAAALEKEGREIFVNVVEDVISRLANQDPSVLEITDEMSNMEKRLLVSRLSEAEVKHLARMKEATI